MYLPSDVLFSSVTCLSQISTCGLCYRYFGPVSAVPPKCGASDLLAEFSVDNTGQAEHAVNFIVHGVVLSHCMSFLLFFIFWLLCRVTGGARIKDLAHVLQLDVA